MSHVLTLRCRNCGSTWVDCTAAADGRFDPDWPEGYEPTDCPMCGGEPVWLNAWAYAVTDEAPSLFEAPFLQPRARDGRHA